MSKNLMTVTLNETWLKSAQYLFWIENDVPVELILTALASHLNGSDPHNKVEIATRWNESAGDMESVDTIDFDEDTLRIVEV